MTYKNRKNYQCRDALEKAPEAVTCVTSSLPAKTDNFTCFYAASTSRKRYAMTHYEAHRSRVNSTEECMLTDQKFAGDFTRGVIAESLKLQVPLCANADIFAYDCASFFPCDRASLFACVCRFIACVWRFLPATLMFWPTNCMFLFLQKQELLHASPRQTCM